MSAVPPGTAPAGPRRLLLRHPVASFFLVTYGVAWLLWAPLVFSRGLPPAAGFLLALLGSLVPSAVAVMLTALLHGRRGVRSLLARLVKWRVGLRWYLVVLLVPLLVLLAVGISVLLGGAVPTVDASILTIVILFAFHIFPGSALGEELGWRGFALPHLQDTRGALATALILGPLWGSWHLPLFLANTDSRPLALFPLFVLSAIALSVVLSWLYNSTGGSLLLVVLLHATANLPVTLLIAPLGRQAMIQPFAIFTAMLVLLAAVAVWMAGATNLSRSQPRQVSPGAPVLPVG